MQQTGTKGIQEKEWLGKNGNSSGGCVDIAVWMHYMDAN